MQIFNNVEGIVLKKRKIIAFIAPFFCDVITPILSFSSFAFSHSPKKVSPDDSLLPLMSIFQEHFFRTESSLVAILKEYSILPLLPEKQTKAG